METTTEAPDIDEILRDIMETHGLTRGEARRWLHEFIDHSKRHRFTQGMPETLVNDGDVDRRTRRKVCLANERRQFIDEDGLTTIPKSDAPSEPEIHIPSGETLFQKSLKNREAGKKPYKVKFAKTKRIGANSVKSPKPKLTEPRGVQSREIFRVLKLTAWNHITARDKLVKSGLFDHYPAKSRNQAALSAVMNIKKRYEPST